PHMAAIAATTVATAIITARAVRRIVTKSLYATRGACASESVPRPINQRLITSEPRAKTATKTCKPRANTQPFLPTPDLIPNQLIRVSDSTELVNAQLAMRPPSAALVRRPVQRRPAGTAAALRGVATAASDKAGGVIADWDTTRILIYSRSTVFGLSLDFTGAGCRIRTN